MKGSDIHTPANTKLDQHPQGILSYGVAVVPSVLVTCLETTQLQDSLGSQLVNLQEVSTTKNKNQEVSTTKNKNQDASTTQNKNQDAATTKNKNRKFQHPDCDKGFASELNLERHRQVHAREKPFPCLLHPYHTSQSINLQNHMQGHTGDTFNCKKCPFRCMNRSTFQRHMCKYHFVF